MAHVSASHSFVALARSLKSTTGVDGLSRCLVPRWTRTFASATDIPTSTVTEHDAAATTQSKLQSRNTSPVSSRVLTTSYSWPDLEPQRYSWYSSQHLDMPLRKDILHRAVIFEADGTRQGTASTKWRTEVHGSNRKLAPQKGLGRARVGDKKSPSRRGGGVAFGPKPRDFSTELPRKLYDIAWRTALSFRYRRGELVLLDNVPTLPVNCTPRLLHNIFTANKWGKGYGRSLIVADTASEAFFEAMAEVGEHGEVKDLDDVDVKDLLKFGRIIIDSSTLDTLLATHSHDLGPNFKMDIIQGKGMLLAGLDSELVQHLNSPAVAL